MAAPTVQKVVVDGERYHFKCPHCLCWTQVLQSQTACCIFRHGQHGADRNYQQLNPHLPQARCEQLLAENKVFGGCAKPFRFVKQADGNHHVEKCGYI